MLQVLRSGQNPQTCHGLALRRRKGSFKRLRLLAIHLALKTQMLVEYVLCALGKAAFAALPSAQSPSIAVQTEQQHGQKVRHALLVPDFRVGEREHQQQPHDQVLDRRALEEQKLAERSRAVLPDRLLALLVL